MVLPRIENAAPEVGAVADAGVRPESEAIVAWSNSARDEILRRIRRRLGRAVRSRVEPEDILQEALLSACRVDPAPRFADARHFVNWILRVSEHRICALHRSFRVRRRARATHALPLELLRYVPDEQLDALANPSLELDRERAVSQRRALSTSIDRLAERSRLVIALRTVQGLSWKEIARRMRCASADAARKLHGRALVALRDDYETTLRASHDGGRDSVGSNRRRRT